MPIMGQPMPMMSMPTMQGKCRLETCYVVLCLSEAPVPCTHAHVLTSTLLPAAPSSMPAGFQAAPTTSMPMGMPMPFMGMPMGMGMPTNPPEELPGDKLTPQECATYGVPFGAVWGAVQSSEEPAMEAEDDVRGTQV